VIEGFHGQRVQALAVGAAQDFAELDQLQVANQAIA
jgi:hypothetical protein